MHVRSAHLFRPELALGNPVQVNAPRLRQLFPIGVVSERGAIVLPVPQIIDDLVEFLLPARIILMAEYTHRTAESGERQKRCFVFFRSESLALSQRSLAPAQFCVVLFLCSCCSTVGMVPCGTLGLMAVGVQSVTGCCVGGLCLTEGNV